MSILGLMTNPRCFPDREREGEGEISSSLEKSVAFSVVLIENKKLKLKTTNDLDGYCAANGS